MTTLFDMVILNELDRYHLVMNMLDRLPQRDTPSWSSRNCRSQPRE